MKEQLLKLGLSEEQANSVVKEFDGKYIPKDKFNTINEELKAAKTTIVERDGQLDTLKKSTEDIDGLKAQITSLQADNAKKDEDYRNDLKELQLTGAIKLAIADKAMDADLVAGLFDRSKLILGDDGKVTGLDEQLKTLETGKAFLFKPKEQARKPAFKVGTDGEGVLPNDSVNSLHDGIKAFFGN